jgi:hypothetical protein
MKILMSRRFSILFSSLPAAIKRKKTEEGEEEEKSYALG